MIYGRELPGYPYNLKAKLTRCLVAARRYVFGQYLGFLSSHGAQPVSASGQNANDLILETLQKDKPCLVARFGSGEMETTLRGIDVQRCCSTLKKICLLIIGESGPFWWDNSIRAGICWMGGFFPVDNEALNDFSNRVCKDSSAIDVLGSWLPGEKYILKHFAHDAKAVPLNDLEPFRFDNPWTRALKGKRVLVIHPFSDTIKSQYSKRKVLFKDQDVLPDFELSTYRTVSSFAGNKVPYVSWFDAMDKMVNDVSKIDFDIAIIGCGAYGLSIGAAIKCELGKKAIHLGGVTQMLFGIKGGRWDGIPYYRDQLYNEYWVRPFDSDKVQNANTIENGCYW